MRVTETARDFRRRRGVELINEGVPQVLITRVLGVSRASLHRWRNAHAQRTVWSSTHRLDRVVV